MERLDTNTTENTDSNNIELNRLNCAEQKDYNTITNWDIVEHIHIDNGGYSFSFLPSENLIKIEAGFYGYSHTSTIFHFNKDMNQRFIEQLEKLIVILKDSDAQKMKGFCSTVLPISSEETTIIFAQEVLTFKNKNSTLQLGAIWNLDIVESIYNLFKEVLEEQSNSLVILN